MCNTLPLEYGEAIMGSVLGKNDAISGVIAGWTVPFSTDFVAHLNGGSGFNSTVGIMTDFALLKISIDQNIKEGETYEIGATASEDHKVRLELTTRGQVNRAPIWQPAENSPCCTCKAVS